MMTEIGVACVTLRPARLKDADAAIAEQHARSVGLWHMSLGPEADGAGVLRRYRRTSYPIVLTQPHARRAVPAGRGDIHMAKPLPEPAAA